jgi:hypothetical protein
MGQRGGVLVFLASDSSQAIVVRRCAGYFPAAGLFMALKAWRMTSVTLAKFVSSGGLVHMSADSCCNSNAVS